MLLKDLPMNRVLMQHTGKLWQGCLIIDQLMVTKYFPKQNGLSQQ
jgi:hypothetical protein